MTYRILRYQWNRGASIERARKMMLADYEFYEACDVNEQEMACFVVQSFNTNWS